VAGAVPRPAAVGDGRWSTNHFRHCCRASGYRRDMPMSCETKDLVSAALSSTALLVSVVTFALNYLHSRKSAVRARKPVLVFEYDGDVGWVLRNVGAGPALNIVVAQKRVAGEWFIALVGLLLPSAAASRHRGRRC
jgi:hypothetical protein